MYGCKLFDPATMAWQGLPTALPKTISLNGERAWTYIPCPYLTPRPLAEGLPVGVPFGLNDQFKSQVWRYTHALSFGPHHVTWRLVGATSGVALQPPKTEPQPDPRPNLRPDPVSASTQAPTRPTPLPRLQFNFAAFYPGYGWFGSLTTVEPGHGYMLWLNEAGGTGTFLA